MAQIDSANEKVQKKGPLAKEATCPLRDALQQRVFSLLCYSVHTHMHTQQTHTHTQTDAHSNKNEKKRHYQKKQQQKNTKKHTQEKC